MDTSPKTEVERAFLSLPPEERQAIISHGTALRLSDLRKRLFLAESKIQHFEEKYQIEPAGPPAPAPLGVIHLDRATLEASRGTNFGQAVVQWEKGPNEIRR